MYTYDRVLPPLKKARNDDIDLKTQICVYNLYTYYIRTRYIIYTLCSGEKGPPMLIRKW